MKFIRVLLIFSIVIRWTNGEHNDFINHKQLKVIANSMDVEAKPCEDFYQYSCGKWSEQYADYATKFNNTSDMMGYQINTELAGVMEAMSIKDKPDFVKKVYDFYTSCNQMDEEWHASFYMDWMKEHENLTWALLPHSNETAFDWVHVLGVTRRYDMNAFFIRLDVVDKEDGGPTRMVIGKHRILTRNPLFTEESLKQLESKMPEDAKSLVELWSTIELFQARLYSLLLEEHEDTERKPISLKDLPQPWLQRIVSIVLNQPSVDANLELFMEDATYLQKLDELLQQYNDSFISRYVEIQLLDHLYSNIADFNSIGCMVMARTLMPLALNWLYEQNHPELQEQIPQVKLIFDNIVHDLNQSLSADQSGLIPKEFLNKLNEVQLKVSNLPRVDTKETLEHFYASLDLTNSNFYINHLNLYAFAYNVSRYYQPNDMASNIDHFYYASEPYTQLPYWLYFANILMVPTVSLRQPLHHWGYDKIYMYSSLGTKIANALLTRTEIDYLKPWHIQQLADVASLRASYKTFFNEYPGAISESQTVHGAEISASQLFFLNAAQFFCKMSEEESREAANNLNTAMSYIPEFSIAFECKTYEYIQFFNKI